MKMTTDIPESITTPDRVETRIGTLEFFDGIPTKETSNLVYDYLDFSRAMETFLNGIPAASIEALRLGAASLGQKNSNQVLYFDELMDSKALFLTGNTSTVYAIPILDLKKDGPTVVEIPAGAGPGTVNDAFFRFVVDMGAPGPDRGKGGKYLILPPDYEGELEGPIGGKAQVIDGETYFVAKSTSYVNWIGLRGFLVDGKPDAAAKMWRDGLKIYPLAMKNNPPKMEFISGSGKSFNTVHANNFEFYEELHSVIEREPVEMLDPELRGLFASIGIEKGKPFSPDARMKKIMTEAVAVANATARAILWDERNKDEFLYEGSHWKRGYVGDSYQFLKDEGMGGRNLDARTHFYYFATVNTPAMAMKLVGAGSQYAWGYLDADGNPLDGSKTYKLNIPKDAPALKFWSVCVYDPQTRSMLQTDQTFPSKQSQRDKLITNDDGSIDLYFGPRAPAGKEANWTQTVPGKGWFCLLRLYSPTEAWFDKTWRPGEIELVK
ncbi:MAG: DUF1254 domain-containing protein [Candidatus Krumholzibacteria bacterium]|nr:DUF1254 domain-containing protein [Candidatus Krumholzibacteria bacterium]MDH5271099.1 DUF1254 domain-containing protein [Candidatus Krumholzibacteria bacterium]